MILGAALAGLGTRAAHRAMRSAGELDADAVLALSGDDVVDGAGARLGARTACHTERRFQLGSSARALWVVTPKGAVRVARGNPFGDAVDDLEALLRREGVRPRP